jgi:quercetin dioxygenase-like cupin family protein
VPAYAAAHYTEIPTLTDPELGAYEWKPVRQHFGIQSFGVNLNIAPAVGDWVIEEHTEIEDSSTRHEELYHVISGRATFVIADEEVEAPAGTFIYVQDPAIRRGARALETGTAVLAIGGEPGEPFKVSEWERKYFE